MALSGAKKFSVGHHHLTCVFVSLLRIISIRKNKREGLTTLQSQSKIANVRRRWFFKFHTHPVRDSKGSCNHQYDSHLQKTLHFELFMAVKFFWGKYRPCAQKWSFPTSSRTLKKILVSLRWKLRAALGKNVPPPESGLLESKPLSENILNFLGCPDSLL